MPTDRIEIKPGYFVEVNQRLRRHAHIGDKPVRKLRAWEWNEVVEQMVGKRPRCGDPLLKEMIDRALIIMRRSSIRRAAKVTGLKVSTIEAHRAMRNRLLPGYKPRDGRKYTLVQKQACRELARNLAQTMTLDKAWAEAGRRLGVNGRELLKQHREGVF